MKYGAIVFIHISLCKENTLHMVECSLHTHRQTEGKDGKGKFQGYGAEGREEENIQNDRLQII